MIRQALIAAATLAMMTGGAMAQMSSESTTTTVAPLAGTSSTTRTDRSVDAFGNKTISRESIQNSGDGSVSTSRTDVRGADGSRETTVRKESSGITPIAPDTSSTTTTTITR